MVKGTEDASAMIEAICILPGNREALLATEANLQAGSIANAIENNDTAWLYGWLATVFSLQGISDAIALAYIETNGNADWLQMEALIQPSPTGCPKLESFDAFVGCGYRKTTRSCSEPNHIQACPVPDLPLRKGDLNQLAASLYLFIRDVCHGYLVGFISNTIAAHANEKSDSSEVAIDGVRSALIAAFRPIFGVGPKLGSMALADLLIAGGAIRPGWLEVGRSMIVIDSLVHNFLHRSGILNAFGMAHRFGASCYGKKGCEVVLRQIAATIDLSSLLPGLPAYHPRLVQSAIWRFCSDSTGGRCNGVAIDDRGPCTSTTCPVAKMCSRVALHPPPDKGLATSATKQANATTGDDNSSSAESTAIGAVNGDHDAIRNPIPVGARQS